MIYASLKKHPFRDIGDNEGPDLHFPPSHSTQSVEIQGLCQNNQSGFNSLHMPLDMGAMKALIFIFHQATVQSLMKFKAFARIINQASIVCICLWIWGQ